METSYSSRRHTDHTPHQIEEKINKYKQDNVNYFFDPLTYYNIYSERGSCTRINPDYANEEALTLFINYVNEKQSKGTLKSEVELFIYLLSLTWIFNIKFDITGINETVIPLLIATGEPDPNHPFIPYIIRTNNYLIDIYRRIIPSLVSYT